MKTVKQIFSRLHIYILCLVLSALFWSWIFSLITDTTAYKKVSVYVDNDTCQTLELTLELEKDLPQDIRMVKVHTLSYVAFDEGALDYADIFIFPGSGIESRAQGLEPITDHPIVRGREVLTLDGDVIGIKVYDAATGTGCMKDFIQYAVPGQEPEDYYMVFPSLSRHLGSLNGSRDDAAFFVAEKMLAMN